MIEVHTAHSKDRISEEFQGILWNRIPDGDEY